MNKFYYLLLGIFVMAILPAEAQIITTEPSVLQESSTGVTIYYHADQGNKGLMNQPASEPIYAHTGVITNKSTSPSDWKYAPSWCDNASKYRLTYVSENLWKLEIGDIRSYYGISDATEQVRQLAFVFRNADGSRQGKTASGGDIFADVLQSGLQVTLTCDLDGTVILPGHEQVTFTALCTSPATLTIAVDGTPIATQMNATQLVASHTFGAAGTYKVTASATINELTVTDELTITYPHSGDEHEYPGGTPKAGAVRQSDGSVLFCLPAPLKHSAVIVGSWDEYQVLDSRAMQYHDYNGNRYFWIRIEGLEPDKPYPYYYLVDGIAVGDPYARLVLDAENDKYISTDVYPSLIPYPHDKVNGTNVPLAVYQHNINDYQWRVSDFHGVEPWRLNIYELLVRDFTGTEGEALGNGTIDAARARIPYLKQLGINAIELLPINEFNGNISWGYNPNFYFAPDKAYGTPDAYKAFIDECHAQGIAVILDMVFNQTDWQHPWYRLYEPGSNPFYNVTAPHAYSVLNDVKQGNALVQQQFEDCLRYWLTEYKVDGFRFDLVKGLGNNDSYANAGDDATNAYNASRVARMKRLHEVVKEVKADAYFINENLATPQEENEMAQDGELNWANLNTQGIQYAIGQQSDSGLERFYAPADNRLWGSTVSYLESHDEQRLAYAQNQYGVAGVKGNLSASMHRLGSAAAQMILTPGAHMVWQFSELGNFENTKNAEGGNNTDPKTVRWNLYDNAQRRGLYDSYAAMHALRNRNPELFAESAQFTANVSSAWWNQGRTLYLKAGSKELVCVINPDAAATRTISVNFAGNNSDDYQVLSKSYGSEPTVNVAQRMVTLAPGCYVVIGNNSVIGVKGVPADEAPIRVYGLRSRIVIEGNPTDVRVYDMTGRTMPSLEVPEGIYIVKAGTETFKVSVR